MDTAVEFGDYSTADGRTLRIYAEEIQGGLNPYGVYISSGTVYNLDVDGHPALFTWPDWALFTDKVNAIAGEHILSEEDVEWFTHRGMAPAAMESHVLVPVSCQCPRCKNRVMDLISFTEEDEDQMQCEVCGFRYYP